MCLNRLQATCGVPKMLHGRDLPLLSLPLTFFCSFLQESDGAAVVSALRFHPVTHCFSLVRVQTIFGWMCRTWHWSFYVRGCACMFVHGHVYISFINHFYSLSMDKARVLHQVESLPYNCRRCNWSHVSQMREFQTLLDFSGTRMSCGSCPEGSNITLHCWCSRKRDDDKGRAPYILKITTRSSVDERSNKFLCLLKSSTGNSYEN